MRSESDANVGCSAPTRMHYGCVQSVSTKWLSACMSVIVFHKFLKGHILMVTAEIWRKP